MHSAACYARTEESVAGDPWSGARVWALEALQPYSSREDSQDTGEEAIGLGFMDPDSLPLCGARATHIGGGGNIGIQDMHTHTHGIQVSETLALLHPSGIPHMHALGRCRTQWMDLHWWWFVAAWCLVVIRAHTVMSQCCIRSR